VEFSVYKNAYNNCCQRIFPLRIHQNEVGWGVAPDPTGRGYSFPPRNLIWLVSAGRGKDHWTGRKDYGRGSGEEKGKTGHNTLVVRGDRRP